MIVAGGNGAGLVAKPVLERLAGRPGPAPIWLMRQAGRYLPEYREVRAQAGGFLDLCYTPELAAEVTLQPLRRFALDAAILFSDILVIPDALGQDVRFVEGEGPQLTPVRTRRELERLDTARVLPHLAPVMEAMRRVKAALAPGLALFGFAGAPWTVAAYMIGGASSRESGSFDHARRLARDEPAFVDAVIDLVTEVTVPYLEAQVVAGADVLQLFDSWAGVLSPAEVERWCVAPAQRIVARLHASYPAVPIVLFPRGVQGLLPRFAAVGAAGISLDTAVPMAWAVRELAGVPCLQGNLDPKALLGPIPEMLEQAQAIARSATGRPHIFNLGHGILPTTPPESVAALVDGLKSA